MNVRTIKHLWLFQVAADLAAVIAAYFGAFLLRFHSDWGAVLFSEINQALGVRETGDLGQELESFYLLSATRIISIIFITLTILYALRDLYPDRRFLRKRPVAWNIVVANVMALALFYAYFYLGRNVFHPRSFFAIVIFLNIFFCISFRSLANQLLNWLRSTKGMDMCRTVLIGSNGDAEFIRTLVSEIHPHGIHIVAQLQFDATAPFEEQIKKLTSLCREQSADLIISADRSLSVAQIMQLIDASEQLDAPIKILSDKLDILPTQAKIPVDFIHAAPLVHFEGPTQSNHAALLLTVFSKLFSYIALALCAPLMGLIAVLIRMTSKGPAIFVQERIGVNRKPFMMYKFRTMYDKADEMRAQVEEFSETTGPLFKLKNDPRVTPLGRFLRRFSLDELPQLFNVVRGEMALVGPRPLPRKDFENYYEEWHYSRHSGMPGLTCLWQVSGRSDVDFHNMCILDIFYLRNHNWILDLKILLRTLWVVIFAKGAY